MFEIESWSAPGRHSELNPTGNPMVDINDPGDKYVFKETPWNGRGVMVVGLEKEVYVALSPSTEHGVHSWNSPGSPGNPSSGGSRGSGRGGRSGNSGRTSGTGGSTHSYHNSESGSLSGGSHIYRRMRRSYRFGERPGVYIYEPHIGYRYY